HLTWSPGTVPGQFDAGEHDVTVRVDDGRGGFDTQTFTLTVPAIPVSGGQNAAGEIDGTVYNDPNGNGVREVAGPLFLGPVPYLGKADSPFDLSGLGNTFFVDDFEHEPTFNQDHQLWQVPGVTVTTGDQSFSPRIISDLTLGYGGLVDSVDEDDGVIDGAGG